MARRQSKAAPPPVRPLRYNVTLAADIVVLAPRKGGGRQVLLVQRGREPFAGRWALPGGFVEDGERIADAAHRELREETGLVGLDLVQLGAFGDPGRDPRGRTVSVVFVAQLAASPEHGVRAGDDAHLARFFPVGRVPPLAFDHDLVLDQALRATGSAPRRRRSRSPGRSRRRPGRGA